MTTTWTTINKPSVTSWSTVPKPQSSIVTIVGGGGTPIGLLLSLTQVVGSSSVVSNIWTPVAKASGTSWTTIPKAT